MEQSVQNGHKEKPGLRWGFTTGSCAAAAAQRAAAMALGVRVSPEERIFLRTPKGIDLSLAMEKPESGEGWASCAVKKDSGDDPDITNGILVFAKVTIQSKGKPLQEEPLPGGEDVQITITGGEGIGKVTKAGLACSVGEAAINPVPRKMILEQVRRVCEELDFYGKLLVELTIPEGAELAKRTYNPRLGVVGGISILGTSGIVEPMSEQALIDTIKVEMNVRRAAGAEFLVVTPGNYGESFLRKQFKAEQFDSVKCSNFIGDALDYAELCGFKGVLLVGHIGKLIKASAGILNTHSKYGDARMEILGVHAALSGASKSVIEKLLACVTTEEAIAVLDEAEIRTETMLSILKKLDFHLKERVHHNLEIGAILFSNQYGYLGETEDAVQLRNSILGMGR
ncbi:cobalt-precorrin-5B (C(1))-methyltransferase CbiD [Sinanaerobacter chloroacetimidivorans]|jgi:cobalt-precorrin-5B (C1)-methyltransferase|uniref:Cobalt-precorrin-5B C(1)-methyltransferase n=1 Tax=Sinanaerobacter chloroacetimidivorans TaxID=2818044 RepID=A0A8J7W0H4_9FIRM|nr:cobalt-precorrin-5B (C(1))-methyltransferase CbiD [Sinanaerobacter chloroacetimidivorans]MBR0597328.1 cobalamin biosynthesis protein CbiD [Sinanaerobacter chloroacetimidivorans]